MTTTVRFTVENLEAEANPKVFFEPEGLEVDLPDRGNQITVEIRHPDHGTIELAWSPGGLTVWPPNNSVVRAWDPHGTELPL